MKNSKILLALFLLYSIFSLAQVTNEGNPIEAGLIQQMT